MDAERGQYNAILASPAMNFNEHKIWTKVATDKGPIESDSIADD